MKKKALPHLLVGALCIALLVVVVIAAIIIDSKSPNPIFGILQDQPTETVETESSPQGSSPQGSSPQGTSPENPDAPSYTTPDSTSPSDELLAPPQDLPPTVEIPTEKDPQTGLTGITFPCQVPGYDLVIEKFAPYSGMYVEDGSNVRAENVAMLLVRNDGDFPIEYTQIRIVCNEEELLFNISALPVGESLVVQESNGKPAPEGAVSSANALVVQRANMDMSETMVSVTDNGDNTLTIQNLTNETIPTVRVFYKYYMEDEGLFVGGIAFTVRILRLGGGASITIQPSHYTSQTSQVVMVLTYDSEV